MKTFGRLLLAILLFGAALSAQAQSWPPKTVHIYVPFGAGSTPEGSIHFAGEHTSTEFYGFLNGAVESGERAAKAVALS